MSSSPIVNFLNTYNDANLTNAQVVERLAPLTWEKIKAKVAGAGASDHLLVVRAGGAGEKGTVTPIPAKKVSWAAKILRDFQKVHPVPPGKAYVPATEADYKAAAAAHAAATTAAPAAAAATEAAAPVVETTIPTAVAAAPAAPALEPYRVKMKDEDQIFEFPTASDFSRWAASRGLKQATVRAGSQVITDTDQMVRGTLYTVSLQLKAAFAV